MVRRRYGRSAFLVFFSLVAPVRDLPAQEPGADSVVAFVPGTGGGFGADSFPGIVLGSPRGAGTLEGSLHVLSLGSGGEITLYLGDLIVVDGPGPDLTVFENPFYISGDSLNRYVETAVVEVSQDGGEFHRFPFDFVPGIEPPGNPGRFVGFAGVEPVLSNAGFPDPTDPSVSGGDHFDLSLVGIPNASFVRIIDTGSDTRDGDGDLVLDNGLDLPPQSGFDLDAVCHVNWTSRDLPFRVESARAIADDRVRVGFSKVLETGQDYPLEYFLLDGLPLSEGDSVVPVEGTELEIRLGSPMETDPPPVLDVSQWIRSVGGENLLDRFDEPVEWAVGLGPDGMGGSRGSGTSPLAVPRPNPFRGSTTIAFEIGEGERGTLAIYDLRGRLVRVLADHRLPPGRHQLSWDGRDSGGCPSPSGIYLVLFSSGATTCRQKLVLLR